MYSPVHVPAAPVLYVLILQRLLKLVARLDEILATQAGEAQRVMREEKNPRTVYSRSILHHLIRKRQSSPQV
jgi:hypothetical protein